MGFLNYEQVKNVTAPLNKKEQETSWNPLIYLFCYSSLVGYLKKKKKERK